MNYILFDIEATCWNGYHSNGIQEIIELAAISIDRFGVENDQYIRFVRPVINPNLSQYCRNLTGITQREVDTALAFEEIYGEFEEWTNVDPDTWFVSWGDFDPEILNEECFRCFNSPSMINNHLDLQASYALMKNISQRTRLVNALEYEGIDFEGEQHRAMTDTRNMKIIFNRYIDHWGMTDR